MADKPLFDDDWKNPVKTPKDSWVSDVLENINATGGIYLECISKWFTERPGTNKQKNHLKASLRSSDNSDHLGAVNELSWWKFLISQNFEFEPIPTSGSPKPDFVLKQKILAYFSKLQP